MCSLGQILSFILGNVSSSIPLVRLMNQFIRIGLIALLLLVACCHIATVPVRAQSSVWEPVHEFGPPNEELPWVLAMGSGPAGEVYAALLQEPRSIYRSTDHGRSWEAGDLAAPHIETIAPQGDGTVFVAAYSDGVLRSDDMGETWSTNTLPSVPAWDVSVRGSTVLAATDGGLYVSVDRGVTWSQLTDSPARSILIARSGDYLATISQGPVISMDDGKTWQPVPLEGNVYGFFEPTEGVLLARTSAGIARSTDGGRSWGIVYQGRAHDFTVNTAGIVFANTGGILRSADGGVTWTDYSAGLTESISAVTVDSTGYLFAGTQSGRIYRTTEPTTQPVADTLDWRRYFPLEVGNEWHYLVGDPDPFIDPPVPDDIARWRIVADTTFDDEVWYALETTVLDQAGRVKSAHSTYVRYDTEFANVIEYTHDAAGNPFVLWFMGVPCGLDGPFGALNYDCKGVQGEMYSITGGYDYQHVIPSTPPDTIEVAASKRFSSLGGGHEMLSDIGLASTRAEQSGWRRLLVYANVGGREYGVPAIPSPTYYDLTVGTERYFSDCSLYGVCLTAAGANRLAIERVIDEKVINGIKWAEVAWQQSMDFLPEDPEAYVVYDTVLYRMDGPLMFLHTDREDSLIFDFDITEGDSIADHFSRFVPEEENVDGFIEQSYRMPGLPHLALVDTTLKFPDGVERRIVWGDDSLSTGFRTFYPPDKDSFMKSLTVLSNLPLPVYDSVNKPFFYVAGMGVLHTPVTHRHMNMTGYSMPDGTVYGQSIDDFDVSIDDEPGVALSDYLHQNYPNPVMSSTSIRYTLQRRSMVDLRVYDVLGRLVAVLVNTEQADGDHTVSIDATNLASGVYMYVLRVNGAPLPSRRMVVLK